MIPEKRATKQSGSAIEPTVRQFFVESIVREMQWNSTEARQLLSKFNIAISGPVNPYATLPLKNYVAFLEAAAALFERPYLGFELGQKFRLWEIGPVYPLLVTAPTPREALQVFSRFQATWQSHTSLKVTRESGETRYEYLIEDLDIWPRIQDAENSIAGLYGFFRQLLSDNGVAVEVSFEHDVSERLEVLRRFFRCRIRGTAESNAIVLRDADLDRPLHNWLSSTAPARALVERHLMDLLRPPEETFRPIDERLAQLISQRLGRESVDLETLASILGTTPRTLRRQLQSFGTSFSEVLNLERRKKAENLLTTGTIKLSQLALHLGYANQSVFSRAFRSWTGETASAAIRRARTKRANRE